MTQQLPQQDFLVLSRGQWDEDKTPEQIQDAPCLAYEIRPLELERASAYVTSNETPGSGAR